MGRWMEQGRARWGVEASMPTDGAESETLPSPASASRNDHTTKVPTAAVDPTRRWRWRNAELLSEDDRRAGRDPGGFCAEHHRWLTYAEQQRGACSWCVPVDAA